MHEMGDALCWMQSCITPPGMPAGGPLSPGAVRAGGPLSPGCCPGWRTTVPWVLSGLEDEKQPGQNL